METALKNLNEFPSSIQPVINEFTQKLLEKFKNNISSVLVYGSAAGVNYNPKVSDVNFALVFKVLDFSVLNQALAIVKWGRQHKIATPLFLTKEYILTSVDVFPVEFSEIKERHKLIFGEDVFKDLDIPRGDMRLLCEQQVKGKLLRLRQAYLDIGSNSPVLKDFLISTFSDLIPIFRQLIAIKGQKPFEQKEEMLGQLAKLYTMDLGPFLVVLHDRNKKAAISAQQVETHLQDFLAQLEILSRHMDTL